MGNEPSGCVRNFWFLIHIYECREGSGHTIAQNIYYVFDGDKIIGQIIVSEIGGLFSSTFSYTVYSEIQCAYEQKYPITLYGLEGCLIAEIDNTVYVLENVDNKDISTLVRQRDILGNAIIKKVTLIEMPIGSRSTYHFLRVANVGNEVSPQGIQICWAACMASKVMYQTNYRNLTAMSVFDKCWESVDNSPYDIPYGVDSWYNSAAALYGISLRIQDSLGSKETTSNALKNGKPIILSVTDDSISHAIVLCGIDEDASYYKNDGEIFLSEKEWEYVELIEEFPKGMQGAAYYTCAFRYGKWLLLGVEESRCLQGMDGCRYFLLIPDTAMGRDEYEMGDGMCPFICCNGAQYQYENSIESEKIADDLDVLGFVQAFFEEGQGQISRDTIQTNQAILIGHLVLAYGDGEKILISVDGGENYNVYSLFKTSRL